MSTRSSSSPRDPHPDPIPQLIDRLLVLADANGIAAAVVLNKIDLDPGTVIAERCRTAGYLVYLTSVKTGEGVESLRLAMTGKASVVTGPSGAGKSSLLNAIQPGLQLRTGEVSAEIRRGRNITVSSVMLPLEGGGYLVDTPGFSEVGMWGVDPRSLADCFPDFRPFLGDCRYGDCRHRSEPGAWCARRWRAGGSRPTGTRPTWRCCKNWKRSRATGSEEPAHGCRRGPATIRPDRLSNRFPRNMFRARRRST